MAMQEGVRVPERIIVILTEINRKFGAGEEYPEGWKGKLTGRKSDAGSLSQVEFSRHFFGKNEKKKLVRKTDGKRQMFIPRWLLQPVPVIKN